MDNVKKGWSNAWPISFLVREVLSDVDNFDEAVAQLRGSALMAPCYITVCGVQPDQGVVITRDRDQDVKLQRLQDGPLVQTNMDHWDNDRNHDIMQSMKRRRIARSMLEDKQMRDVESMWKLLRTAPILNDITVYSTVMDPLHGTIDSRVSK
jgi:hypothetical protein